MKLCAAFLAVLASGAIAHADAAIKLQPQAQAKCTDKPEVTVSIDVVARGAWLGSSTGARCFVPRKDKALDDAALDTELATLVASFGPDCSTTVQLAASAGVSYQDVVTAMDHAKKAGLVQVAITDPKSMPIKFDDTAAKEHAAPHCTAPASSAKPVKPAPAASKPGAAAAEPPTQAAIDKAPIVIVSKTEVTVGGNAVGSIKSLARGKGAIAALVTMLRTLPDKGPLILQADASTDAAVLNRVIASAHAAGFDDVLFAVKTK